MNKIKRTPAIIPPSKYGFKPDPSDFKRTSTVAFAVTVIAGSVGSVSCGKGLVFDFVAFIAAKYSYIYIYICRVSQKEYRCLITYIKKTRTVIVLK